MGPRRKIFRKNTSGSVSTLCMVSGTTIYFRREILNAATGVAQWRARATPISYGFSAGSFFGPAPCWCSPQLDRFLLNAGAAKARFGAQQKGPKFMQRVVAAFPKQAQLPNDYLRTSEPDHHRSGFFTENPPALAKSELAAALVLAVHRRLIEQPIRKHLPLR